MQLQFIYFYRFVGKPYRWLSATLLVLWLTLTSLSSFAATILVQGAMDIEIEQLTRQLKNVTTEQSAGWYFWKGKLHEHTVIISRTEIGLVNAAAATTLAILRYQPDIIINQGTAGGLIQSLQQGDIVIADRSVNVGAFRSEYRAKGEGSQPQHWIPFDIVMRLRNSQGDWVNHSQGFNSEPILVKLARNTIYQGGQHIVGAIGSADAWHKEIDRIDSLIKIFDIVAEDMESSAAAQIAYAFNIPFIAIRVISDSEANQQNYRPHIAVECQQFVSDFIAQIPINFIR